MHDASGAVILKEHENYDKRSANTYYTQFRTAKTHGISAVLSAVRLIIESTNTHFATLLFNNSYVKNNAYIVY